MSERKIWKQQQDEIMKKIYEEMGIKKWTDVSKMMKDVYGIDGRNGKQCRERYHNHLKGGIRKQKWTWQEQKRLIELHSQHGNRWAFLSRMIAGRTQNCVKNMLYSRLRKSVRQLNKFSWQHYRRVLKLINTGFIYRLIEFTENSYKKEESERSQQEKIAIKIKDAILQLELEENAVLDQQKKSEVRELIENIHQFKRDHQHFRGNRGVKNGKTKRPKKISDQLDSDYQVSLSVQASAEKHQNRLKLQKQHTALNRKQVQSSENSQSSEQQQMQQQMRDFKNQIQQPKEQKQQPTIKVQNVERNDAFNDASQRTLLESIFIGRQSPIVTMVKRESADSSLSFLFTDKGLQNPIKMQNPFFNLTPTPLVFHRNLSDWTTAISSWNPHISNN